MSIAPAANGRFRRRGKVKALAVLGKKFLAFLFSHIGLCGLMVAYTMLGSVLFRAIEGPHERDTHQMVRSSRSKAVGGMWASTYKYNVKLDIWTSNVSLELHEFKWLLLRIIQKGYDANDQEDNTQWTFSGAFLYSLTVITTIGYGNIACRTAFGKSTTIVYAILGIPLMLLFLTNIGDVLAKTFKFLYRKSVRLLLDLQIWNKKRKARQFRRATNTVTVSNALKRVQQQQMSPHSRHLLSPLLSHQARSTDSGSSFEKRQKRSPTMTKASLETRHVGPGTQTVSRVRRDSQHRTSTSSTGSFKGSRKGHSPATIRADHQMADVNRPDSSRSASLLLPVPSAGGLAIVNAAVGLGAEDVSIEQIRMETLAQKYELEELSLRESTEERLSKLTVPLWLMFATMLAYLFAGATMFTVWEGWSFFNSFYFCYISLATIGFGDLFPGTSLKDAGSSQEKLIITSFYLLLGMALIAMCFNLAQEEVVNKMSRVAGKLGIIHNSDRDASVYEPE